MRIGRTVLVALPVFAVLGALLMWRRSTDVRPGTTVAPTNATDVEAPVKPAADANGSTSLLVVTLDTVRADHMGSYGYSRNTSPSFDALAKQGTLYTRAMASSSWTLPSHASMFTGLEPSTHAAHRFLTQEKREGNVSPLAESYLTIAEVLAQANLRTSGFAANTAYVTPDWGLAQGFETFVNRRVPGVKLNQRVFEWLEQNRAQPFFLFVNYMDAHSPYNTTPRPGVVPGGDVPKDKEVYRKLMRQHRAEQKVDEDLLQLLTNQYDLGLANADHALGKLIERMRELGLMDNTLIVVMSDHGEYLGEHQLVGHDLDVYQGAIWIPLVILAPGQTEAARSDEVVTSADLPRLISKHLTGPAFAPFRKRFDTAKPSVPLIELHYTRPTELFNKAWGHRFRRIRRATYEWPHKYIASSDGAHELYDLEADPLELDNRIKRDPSLAAELARKLDERFTAMPKGEVDRTRKSMKKRQMRELRALGYAN